MREHGAEIKREGAPLLGMDDERDRSNRQTVRDDRPHGRYSPEAAKWKLAGRSRQPVGNRNSVAVIKLKNPA
jgi:hypothetical protein